LAAKGQVTTCLCCNGEAKHFANFRNKNRVVRRFRCVRCGKTFSEPQPLDGLRLDNAKVVQIVKLLTEGLGVRAVARFVDCDPHTVLGVLETIGQKCESFHDRIVRHVTTDSLQLDEIWTRVGCSQKLATRQGDDFERGDFYTFLAIAAREKFIVSYHTGKRDLENTDVFVEDVAKRVDGRIQITTDSFRPYLQIVRNHLLGRLDFATMQKLFAVPFDARAEAARRYSPAQCTGIRVRVRAGAPRQDRISTSFVERANLSVRHFNKRFARLGLGYSRKLANHRYAIALFVTAYNFCKVHTTLGCTPAVGLKLATETWTIEKLIEEITK
jgi:IS1 family transposase/transposase-like protein